MGIVEDGKVGDVLEVVKAFWSIGFPYNEIFPEHALVIRAECPWTKNRCRCRREPDNIHVRYRGLVVLQHVSYFKKPRGNKDELEARMALQELER